MLLLVAALAARLPMFGFSPAAAATEFGLERRFADSIDKAEIGRILKRLSARPHNIGSAYQASNTAYILRLYKSWGFEAHVERYDVLFPTPRLRQVELLGPTKYRASLTEPPVPGDPTTYDKSELPPYNAYSPDGDVVGKLVYVNYGTPEDYKTLARLGVKVEGCIVIARYGGCYRGVKPKVAAEHGAVGCLIYSDPRDDGYGQGDVYPKGGFRNAHGVQRGSIADMTLYPGDPLTPGRPSLPGVPRLSRREATTIAKIPTQPMSYGDALPLLKAIGGTVAPAAWRGGLPITYHVGPGPARVHLVLKFDWKTVPCRDVVATLRGREHPDERIIRGNHYDGWAAGAEDPLTGQSAMLEEARAVGALAKTGWRPKRTIVYCSWDGEEPGLIGSTEYCEAHAAELDREGAVYINTDDSGRGFFHAGGSPALARLVGEVARDVVDPETGMSILDRDRATSLVDRGTPENDAKLRQAGIELGPLGSGSDFTAFLQHAGIAALDYGFGGEGGGGSYHSAYDTYKYVTRFIDPGFRYLKALCETAGRTTLRLADADRLPMEFTATAAAAKTFASEVEQLASAMRSQTEELNKLLADGTYKATLDPSAPGRAPARESVPPKLEFSALDAACAEAIKAAQALKPPPAGEPIADATFDAFAMRAERAFLLPQGLPERPWFRHVLYAPGFYTGYGVKTLPGVREAIEARDWPQAQAQIAIAAAALRGFAAELADTASKLDAITSPPAGSREPPARPEPRKAPRNRR